jgi:hypothetical protein
LRHENKLLQRLEIGALTIHHQLAEGECMVRRLVYTVAAAGALGMWAQPATAQFAVGYTDVGATVGLGGIGDASLACGGRFELGFRDVPEFNNGFLGIQAAVDYYSWSSDIPSADYSVSWIPIGVTANYHFNLMNDRIDPFLGLGLGYEIVSCDYPGVSLDCGYSSGIYPIGRAGIRYFMNRLALYADAGAGAAALNIGAMFRVR